MRIELNRALQGSLKKLFWKKGQKVLFALQQPVLDLAGEIMPEDLKIRVPRLLKPEPVNDYLTGIWVKSGSIFAMDTIKRIHRVARKQEEDELWWEDFFRRWYTRERSMLKTGAILDTQAQLINNLIDGILEEGFSNGLGIPEIQRQMRSKLAEGLTEINTYQAERIARTEVIGASNTGSFEGAKESGVALGKEWMTSGLPGIRQSHLDYEAMGRVDMDYDYNIGLKYPGDPNGGPEEIINCYTGDLEIKSLIISAQRSFYSGEIIEIITRGGKRITVTPNHNILTSIGFVKAKNINIGNDLICNSENIKNRFVMFRWRKNINNKVSFIKDVFDSINRKFASEFRFVTHLDFDNDGAFMNGEIAIIDSNRELPINNKIFIKQFGKFGFKHSAAQTILIKRFCGFNFRLNRMLAAFYSFMSFLNLSFLLRFSHVRPFNLFAIGLSSHNYAIFDKMSIKSDPFESTFLRNLIETNPRFIHLDKVINVRNIKFSGHVYDFTSLTGTNIVNNIYTSNCRCTIGYEV